MAQAAARPGFVRDQRRGFYTGVIMLGCGIMWRCSHQHNSLDQARDCATAENADRLLDFYDEIRAEEAKGEAV
jgi:hypothetical protein